MTDRSTNLSTPAETVGQWPETVVSNTERDNDLGPPLVLLLRDLGIKGTLNDENSAGNPTTAARGTPVSVSIIEAGATAASEGSAALIAALVGATAVWGAVSGFWKNEGAIRGDLVVAAAVVIAACALGIALINSRRRASAVPSCRAPEAGGWRLDQT